MEPSDNSGGLYNLGLSHHRGKKRIKVLVVLAEEVFQKIGDLEVTAPVGIGIDDTTGELTTPLKLEPIGEPVLKAKIVGNSLINEGFLKVLLMEDAPDCDCERKICQHFVIPLQSVVDIKGIESGDDIQESVTIESLSVFGLPDDCMGKIVGSSVKLVLKVILKVKVVISKEEIITCSCDSDSDLCRTKPNKPRKW